MACRFFFRPFVTIPVVPVITGITTQFMLQVQLSFVVSLLNVLLVWLADFSLDLLLLFLWSQFLPV
jgi:hypothetical protein